MLLLPPEFRLFLAGAGGKLEFFRSLAQNMGLAQKEAIRDGVTGKLVTPGSAEKLASAIAELVRSPHIQSMGQAARRWVEEKRSLRQ